MVARKDTRGACGPHAQDSKPPETSIRELQRRLRSRTRIACGGRGTRINHRANMTDPPGLCCGHRQRRPAKPMYATLRSRAQFHGVVPCAFLGLSSRPRLLSGSGAPRRPRRPALSRPLCLSRSTRSTLGIEVDRTGTPITDLIAIATTNRVTAITVLTDITDRILPTATLIMAVRIGGRGSTSGSELECGPPKCYCVHQGFATM